MDRFTAKLSEEFEEQGGFLVVQPVVGKERVEKELAKVHKEGGMSLIVAVVVFLVKIHWVELHGIELLLAHLRLIEHLDGHVVLRVLLVHCLVHLAEGALPERFLVDHVLHFQLVDALRDAHLGGPVARPLLIQVVLLVAALDEQVLVREGAFAPTHSLCAETVSHEL